MGTPQVEIEALVLDLDGTFVDTEGMGAAGVARFARNLGFHLTDDEAVKLFGGCGPHELAAVLRANIHPSVAGRMNGRLASMASAAIGREIMRADILPMPGAVEILTRVRAHGNLKYAMASNAPHKHVRSKLERSGLAEFFRDDRIFSSEDVGGRGKPSPELFHHVAGKIGVDPSKAAVLEDSVAGVVAGREFGALTVGISADPDTRHELLKAGAHHAVPSLLDVPAVVPQLASPRAVRKLGGDRSLSISRSAGLC